MNAQLATLPKLARVFAEKAAWVIPEDLFTKLPLAMAEIAINGDCLRDRIAAAKVVAAMHGQNQKDDPATIPHEHRHTLTLEQRRQGILARIGSCGDD